MKKIILGLAFVMVVAVASIAAQTLTVWDFKFQRSQRHGRSGPYEGERRRL